MCSSEKIGAGSPVVKVMTLVRPERVCEVQVPKQFDFLNSHEDTLRVVQEMFGEGSKSKASVQVAIDGVKVGELHNIKVSERRTIQKVYELEGHAGSVSFIPSYLTVERIDLGPVPGFGSLADEVQKLWDSVQHTLRVPDEYSLEIPWWRGASSQPQGVVFDDLRVHIKSLIASGQLNETQTAEAVEVLMILADKREPSAIGTFSVAEGDHGVGRVTNVPLGLDSLYATGSVPERMLLGCLGLDMAKEDERMLKESKLVLPPQQPKPITGTFDERTRSWFEEDREIFAAMEAMYAKEDRRKW